MTVAEYKVILSGEFTAIPKHGAPTRVLYEHAPDMIDIQEGITHFRFQPLNPTPKPTAILPLKVSVHCLPKTTPFPDRAEDIERLQNSWGLEPGPKADAISGMAPTITVGVNTEWLTNDTGESVDAHWRAILTFAE